MTPYEYHVTGRDPFYLIVTLFGIACVAGAAYMGAPWWVLAIWGLCAVLLVWQVYVNPKAGMTLSGKGLRVYQGKNTRFFKLDEIEHVRIRIESEGPDFVRLYLRDGTSFTMPSDSVPGSGKLRKQLALFGISHDPA
ncbi:MAG: hypothetical protein AAFQ47_11080 [Pseudomonadota bacterium]